MNSPGFSKRLRVLVSTAVRTRRATASRFSMFALLVVEHPDVIEHVLPSFFAGFVGHAPDPFALEQIEKLSATALS